MEGSQDMHETLRDLEQGQEAGTSHPKDISSFQKDFNVQLKFDYINIWGIEIYHDIMKWYVYKTMECPNPFEKLPWVNYQGDMYIREDGARYKVANHPKDVEASSFILAPKGTVLDISLQRRIGSKAMEQSQGTKESGTPPNPFVDLTKETNDRNQLGEAILNANLIGEF